MSTSIDETSREPLAAEVLDRGAAVCVVGAGPAGLAAARALREHGVAYRQYERHDRVGGIWDIGREGGPMYESASFISSRTMSAFHRFPMPTDYPDYPDHRQVLAYCESFARAAGLYERLVLGVDVRSVEPAPDGGWLVTTSPVGQEAVTIERYRAVICASGAQWLPRIPDLLHGFSGELLPARDYRTPEPFAGRRVLVVGAGNSGCDIAADIGQVAERCVISARRGYWFVPKHIAGMPSDTLDAGTHWMPRRLRRLTSEIMLRAVVGDLRRYGLRRPDHHLLDSHPIIGTRVLEGIRDGHVTARGDVARVEGRTVVFDDGRREDFDVIVAATGYDPTVPYAGGLLTGIGDDELYLGSFSRRHPGLVAIGLGESNAGGFPMFDAAASVVAQHLADQERDRPKAERFARRIADYHPDLTGGLRLPDSPRHRGYIDSEAFTRAIARTVKDMGWTPPSQDPRTAPPATGTAPAPRRRRTGRFDFVGATIALTGATGGLGSCIAEQAAARGATVVAIDLDEDRLVEVVSTLPTPRGQVHRIIADSDLSDPEAVARLGRELAGLERLDALVSNAGMAVGGDISLRSDEDLATEVQVNLIAPLQLLREALPRLVESPHPRVVLTGSLGGVIAMGTDPVYAATKFGLRGAALSLGLALRGRGVAVSIVQPSAIDTPMLEREAESGAEPSQFITPPQSPEDVARSVIGALERPRPEVYPQRVDGVLARAAMLVPGILPQISRLADRLGRPGLERYRASLREHGSPARL